MPVGTYQVGVDIPEGLWTVSAGMDSTYCWMMAGDALEDNGREIDFLGSDAWHDFTLASPYSYDDVEYLQRSEESVYLPDGYYVEVSTAASSSRPITANPTSSSLPPRCPRKRVAPCFPWRGFPTMSSLGSRISSTWQSGIAMTGSASSSPSASTRSVPISRKGTGRLSPRPASSACVEYGPGLMGSQMGLSISGSWAEYLYSEDYPLL